jgi:hypothetical protein
MLAGEVLVEHGFADARPLGDLVHGGGVVALRHEDLACGAEQLAAASGPGQPSPPWAHLWCRHDRVPPVSAVVGAYRSSIATLRFRML